MLALGIYIGIYFLSQISPTNVNSYYYSTTTTFSKSPSSLGPNLTSPTSNSQDILVIVKTIGFGWVFWKLGNALYILDVIASTTWQRKLIAAGVMTLSMCALDFVLSALAVNLYEDWMFVLGVAVVTVILGVGLLWGKEKWHVVVRDSLLPYMTYVGIIVVYWLAMPLLFSQLTTTLSTAGKLTFFYIFPVIDTILYLLLLGLHSVTSKPTHEFSSQIHLLLQGYRVGIILLINYYEVEFYYILGFFMLRNLFVGYVI